MIKIDIRQLVSVKTAWCGYIDVTEIEYEVEPTDVGSSLPHYGGFQHPSYKFTTQDVGRRLITQHDGSGWTCWGFRVGLSGPCPSESPRTDSELADRLAHAEAEFSKATFQVYRLASSTVDQKGPDPIWHLTASGQGISITVVVQAAHYVQGTELRVLRSHPSITLVRRHEDGVLVRVYDAIITALRSVGLTVID